MLAGSFSTGAVESRPTTVMVNVCAALVSAPPFAVPPVSCTCTVTVAVPLTPAAGVNVKAPAAEIAGCIENSATLLLLAMKFSSCGDSSAGPALIDVAQPTTDCVPAEDAAI